MPLLCLVFLRSRGSHRLVASARRIAQAYSGASTDLQHNQALCHAIAHVESACGVTVSRAAEILLQPERVADEHLTMNT